MKTPPAGAGGRRRAWSIGAQLADQRVEHGHFVGMQVGQRRAHRARIVADQPGAGLDDADRIAGAAVADLEIRQEELVQQAVGGVVVVRGDGAVELHRGPGHEVEDGRRVDRHAQRLVGRGVDLGGGQSAQVREAVAELAADAHHGLDIADAVLETDQVGAALGQLGQAVGRQARLGAVVDDDADLDGLADLLDVVGDALLRGLGQVVGQQQHALGAEALGLAGIGDGDAGGAACAGQDRHLAGAGVHGGADDIRVFVRRQREELAGAAGGEQGGGAVGREPFQAPGIRAGVEIALRVEVGHGEGEQAFRNDGLEFLRRGHGRYPLVADARQRGCRAVMC